MKRIHNEHNALPKLTKVVSELPNLKVLCISSEILPPTALTSSSLSDLRYLQYNLTSISSFTAFVGVFSHNRKGDRTRVLPGLVGLCINKKTLKRVAGLSGRMDDYLYSLAVLTASCSARGIDIGRGWALSENLDEFVLIHDEPDDETSGDSYGAGARVYSNNGVYNDVEDYDAAAQSRGFL